MKLTGLIRPQQLWRLSKEGSWVIFGNVVSILGSVVGVRIVTEYLDPHAYGELSLGVTLATLVGQVIFGPLGNGAARFYAPAQEKHDLGGYVISIRRLTFKASVVVLFLAFLASVGLWLTGHTGCIIMAVPALIFGLASGLYSLLNGIQNAARQRSIVAIHQGLEPWIRYLLALGMMLLVGFTSSATLIGFSLAVGIVIVSQYSFIGRCLPSQPGARDIGNYWTAQIWKYSWPFAGWGIFTWAQMASDRWALEAFAPTSEVGLYTVLFQLGYYPLSTASAMSMQFFAPILYQRAGTGSNGHRQALVSKMSWRLSALVIGIMCFILIMAFLFHRQLFALLIAREYASVSYLLPWMVLAGGIFSAGQTVSLNLMSQLKSRKMMICKIVTASTGLLLNIAGAYLFGVKGVVGGVLAFSVIYLLWIARLSQRADRDLSQPAVREA